MASPPRAQPRLASNSPTLFPYTYKDGSPMRTKFWRVAYEESRLDEILASETLPFPDFSRWPQARNSSIEKVICDIRTGHFLLLANFDRTSRDGTVRGVGSVLGREGNGLEVRWKKPIPTWMLTPNDQGGVTQWINEPIFCFDASPAKRYQLQARCAKMFPPSN